MMTHRKFDTESLQMIKKWRHIQWTLISFHKSPIRAKSNEPSQTMDELDLFSFFEISSAKSQFVSVFQMHQNWTTVSNEMKLVSTWFVSFVLFLTNFLLIYFKYLISSDGNLGSFIEWMWYGIHLCDRFCLAERELCVMMKWFSECNALVLMNSA